MTGMNGITANPISPTSVDAPTPPFSTVRSGAPGGAADAHPKNGKGGESVSFGSLSDHSHKARMQIRRLIPAPLLNTRIERYDRVSKQEGHYSNKYLTLDVRGDNVAVKITPAGADFLKNAPLRGPLRTGMRMFPNKTP